MESVKGVQTQEALSEKISAAGNDPVRQQALRAAAAIQITQPESRLHTEHRLQRWVSLIENNPRSMKRLVNAVAMKQAVHFLEDRTVSPETLVQWTIIELRWPVLADFLATKPSSIKYFVDSTPPPEGLLPEDIATLFSDAAVMALVQGAGIRGAKSLGEESLRELLA